jgi:hypothetical protein
MHDVPPDPPGPPEPHRLHWTVPASRPWSAEIGAGTMRLSNDPLDPVGLALEGRDGHVVTGTMRLADPFRADRDGFHFEVELDTEMTFHDLLRLFGAAHIEPVPS